MKTKTKTGAGIACALLIGISAVTAHWVRAAPGAQAGTSDDAFGLGIPLRPAKPYILTGDTEHDRGVWVTQALKRMRTVRAGMTRRDLYVFFGPAGGWLGVANPPAPGNLCGVYSYRYCPNFKVDVEFKPVRKAEITPSGDKVIHEDPNDVIVKISRPFVDEVYSD